MGRAEAFNDAVHRITITVEPTGAFYADGMKVTGHIALGEDDVRLLAFNWTDGEGKARLGARLIQLLHSLAFAAVEEGKQGVD